MNLNQFIQKFAEQFDDTELDEFTPDCKYKELEEWSSLSAMSVIAFVRTEYGKTLEARDIRKCNTIEDLYNHIFSIS